MAELEIKNREGKPVGSMTLSGALAEAKTSSMTLHRTIVAEEAAKRQGTQKTRGRSEVRGGGRKPYRQKKTGRARQGSIRAPHYAHGGMALALSPRDYAKKVNRRERRAAILTSFASKVQAGDVVAVDAIRFAEPKTKEAARFLEALGLAGCKRVLVVLPEYDEVAYKSFRNLPGVEVRTAPARGEGAAKTAAFSARDLLVAHKIVIAREAIERMQEVWSA